MLYELEDEGNELREKAERAYGLNTAGTVVGMCLCGSQFGEGKKKLIDYVTCKECQVMDRFLIV